MKFITFFLFTCLIVNGQTEFEIAEQFLIKKQFAKAEEVMRAYVNNNPQNTGCIELLADAYSYQTKWDEAIANYKMLIALSPKTANFHYKYGGALVMKAISTNKIKAMGMVGDMKQAFINAANLDPNHIETRWALVKLYMELPGFFGGSKRKALKYSDELYSISKVDGYLAKGYIYEYDKEFDLAEKHYKLAIFIGGSLHCYEQLTNLYKRQKQFDKAISTMESAYNKHKNNLLNYQIGKLCADYNIQLEKGKAHLQIYIKNYSNADELSKAWANYSLAQIFKHQNNKKDALQHIEFAIAELQNEAIFKKEKQVILSLK